MVIECNGALATTIRYRMFYNSHPDGAQIIASTVLSVTNSSLRPARANGQPELGGSTKARGAHVSSVANVTTILEIIQSPTNATNSSMVSGPEPPVIDDVYDTLVWLGRSSLPCLTDRLTDSHWMPDPRSEPLLGVPLVADVACRSLA
jgi:hypothetical protein